MARPVSQLSGQRLPFLASATSGYNEPRGRLSPPSLAGTDRAARLRRNIQPVIAAVLIARLQPAADATLPDTFAISFSIDIEPLVSFSEFLRHCRYYFLVITY